MLCSRSGTRQACSVRNMTRWRSDAAQPVFEYLLYADYVLLLAEAGARLIAMLVCDTVWPVRRLRALIGCLAKHLPPDFALGPPPRAMYALRRWRLGETLIDP